MKIKRIHILLALLAACICAIPFRTYLRRPIVAAIQMSKGKKTVADRVKEYEDVVHARLAPAFQVIGMAYPPKKITLIALKAERILEVWVSETDGQWKYLKSYPILGMSGGPGPKLREGDMQVPEGIESLNPNSLYHLALRLNYPNQEDIRRGKEDGRSNLGSDIMIHGKTCSIGCLAMGDEAAEDLFILTENTGIQNITVILAPVDFRTKPVPQNSPSAPKWTKELYMTINKELERMKR